jgi:hypothetical protein
VSEQFHHGRAIMAKTNSTDEELRGIMQMSSDEKHLEYEEKGESEDNNVLTEEEIDNEIEANALQREEDLKNDEFATVSCTTNQTFSYSWNTAEVQNICCYEKESSLHCWH